jgi:hypothetical protein
MKLRLLFVAVIFIQVFTTHAQVRYLDQIFAQADVTTDIVYGSALDYQGNSVDLKADIYTPLGDTVTRRPIVILMHGGFFLAGSKQDPEMDLMCRDFAKRGYVAISIQYRLGANLFAPDLEEEFSKAAIRAVQDLKGAIRFFRESADSLNPYGIEGQVVFTGGYSAGAIAAIHAGYLTSSDNLEPWLNTAIQDLGGLEGSIGNMNYSSNTYGIINLSGGIFELGFIQGTDPLMASVHGDQDGTVPYDSGTVSLGAVNIIDLYGSNSMHVNNPAQISLLSLPGEDHFPLQNPSLQDTILEFYANFMFSNFNPNTLHTVESGSLEFSIYPNPASSFIHVQCDQTIRTAELRDFTGRVIKTVDAAQGVERIDVSQLPTGMYSLYFPEINRVEKIVIQQ